MASESGSGEAKVIKPGKAKGTVVVAAVKALRHYPGGREVTPEPLQPYLGSRRVLASQWYPEEDYIALLAALAPILEKNRAQVKDWPATISVWEFIGRSAVRDYYEGAYRTLFKEGDVVASLRNFRSFWGLRHDTGQARVTLGEEGSKAVLELDGYSVVSSNHCKVIEGSIWGFLFYGGADPARIKIRKLLCTSQGAPVCRWELSW